MDKTIEKNGMLDFLPLPGFYAENYEITQVNAGAAALLVTPGTDVRTLLLTGQEELDTLREGCLYLKLNLTSAGMDATVARTDGKLLFLLNPHAEGEFHSMALAARELRSHMSGAMFSASRLEGDSEELARLNRSLHQMLRLAGNMSDAGRLTGASRQQLINVAALFDEIFEKAGNLLSAAGIVLTYQGLRQDVSCLADGELLERAVFNILSNAAKFTPKGGEIQASLTRSGRMLRLQVTDTGSGIGDEVRGTLFQRYLRHPGIEDSRFGMGLGMVMIRNAAASHGGTVLVDQSKDGGTRITMTLTLHKSERVMVHSPILRVDYAGEWDHALVELSDVLPLELYK